MHSVSLLENGREPRGGKWERKITKRKKIAFSFLLATLLPFYYFQELHEEKGSYAVKKGRNESTQISKKSKKEGN